MANAFNINSEIDTSKIKRTVIPDNEYLPFINISDNIKEMGIGEITAWPISKLNSVRIIAGRIGRKMGRVYRCVQNRKEKTIDVCRFS